MTGWLTTWHAWRTATTNALSRMVAQLADTQPSSAAASATSKTNPAVPLAITDVMEATMTTDIVLVTNDAPTREDLIEKLRNVNARAMAISRRGYVGIHSDEYGRRHDDINAVLDELADH